jgi:hypothetical protein
MVLIFVLGLFCCVVVGDGVKFSAVQDAFISGLKYVGWWFGMCASFCFKKDVAIGG